MELVHNIEEVRSIVSSWKKEGLSVGLVPTMGYLHEGHQSLIKKAVEENDRVVVSIFVNPMQFGENEDLETYPRDLNKDSKLCDEAGADLIFNPEPEEMYKEGFCSYVDMNGLTTELCGKSRPIHFRGVMTVVTKLFNIVTPDRVYFGMKDAQQLCVIKRMVKDLNMDIDVIGCPIIREKDGLAKSSRNTYLNKEERKAALILYKTISLGKDLLVSGERDVNTIINKMKDNINKEPLAKIDYVEAVDLETVEKIDVIKGKVLIAMAVYIGKTRLIDNFTFEC
ncbi:pantoate--beta-alanine ligase [uncultured Anaerofustis sp.]|uniref:pantoate--beta-alanine ligase n=1 Tax=uncultured Anaerofustis sp. TaxID=904996 RepID=UPI0025CFC5FD|nr:pantoate--beta-alanine ligase [uncultured Anaerofustis sp.]